MRAEAASETVLRASDAALYDKLGSSVSVSGDYAVVGAPDDSGVIGVNVGSAYVFRRTGSGWVEAQKLVAQDGAAYDKFGYSVSIDGDVIVVGAAYDRDRGTNSGSVYVYHRNDSGTPTDPSDDRWEQRQKLGPSDGAAYDYYGASVGVSGATIIVGAPQGDASFAYGNGAAYVYGFNGTSWVLEARLSAFDGALGDRFGAAVAVSGSVALVGAYLDRDADQGTGSAFMFQKSGSTWAQTQQFLPSGPGPYTQFGTSVALHGDLAVIGDPFDDDRGGNFGSASVFRFNGSTWVREAELYGSDAATNERFGAAVAAGDNEVLVGAYNEGSGGPTSMDGYGAAYHFRKRDAGWAEAQKLVDATGARLDGFGQSVGLSGDVVVIGVPGNSDALYKAGAAFAYGSGCAFHIDCNDGNPCTTDTCLGGECSNVNNSDSCNDGDACTTADRCSLGSCRGTPINCDDGISCTVDSCVSGTCRHDDANCECTGNLDCNDGNVCTTDTCLGGACSNVNNSNSCNDGNPCTTADRCSLGSCRGTPINCDDGLSCTVDSCVSGVCQHNDTNCECGVNLDCNDSNVCTTDTCLAGACTYVNNSNVCNDGSACTTGDRCSGGQCSGTPVTCDDGMACTSDRCVAGTCVFDDSGCECVVDAECDDGNACTTDRCAGGSCSNAPTAQCCGNGTCEAGEDPCGCPEDCEARCGNGVCEVANAENCLSCPSDCNGEQGGQPDLRFCCGSGAGRNPVDCGDPRCWAGGSSCEGACCGDGFCDVGENGCDCPDDCGRPASSERPDLTCGDQIDNDCDGLADCDDPDCAADRRCPGRALRMVSPTQP
jgi:hypothetical protein